MCPNARPQLRLYKDASTQLLDIGLKKKYCKTYPEKSQSLFRLALPHQITTSVVRRIG
jgi:hypothetical protein